MIGLGRLYSVSFVAVNLTSGMGDQDLFYLKPAADKPIVLEQVKLANVGGTADMGDAQEEGLRIEYIRLPSTVTAGSLGTSPTIHQIMDNDTNASFTARCNDGTVATTSGTAETLDADGWNGRIPYIWMPPPEHRVLISNAQALVVRLGTGAADDFLASGTAYVREWP